MTKETKSVRFTIDCSLTEPHDVNALKSLRTNIEDAINALPSISVATCITIAPAEADFDWQGQ